MSPTRSAQPPCVVLGLESQIGLNVVRELGRAGVHVIGVTHDPHAIALKSRFLADAVVVSQPRSEELLQALRRIGVQHGRCPLLAISEVNLLWLAEHRSAMGDVHPVLPDSAALAVALDKNRTLQAARAVGIEVPESWQPLPSDDLEVRARAFPFPAVLKWSDPNQVAPLLAAARLPLVKAQIVSSADELLAVLGSYAPIGCWPIVQEYCAGRGLGQFFFMRRGEVLRRFQHVRIAEWPPEGGFSSVCDAVPLDEHVDLQHKSAELLRSIGWHGVAMVEYRHDPATGKAKLMEINGRFWGSFPLAYHCGAAFALAAYRDAIGAAIEPLPALRDDLRCRMVATELKRLVRILFQPGRIVDRFFVVRPAAEVGRFVVDFFRARVRYYVWSTSDPLPSLADAFNLILRRSK